MAVDVRIATLVESDLDDVLALWRRTEGVGLNESDTPEALARYLRRNPDLSQTARLGDALLDDVLVGAVLCGHDGRRGYLHHLAVDAAHRRQGIGRRLVAACLVNLASEGISRCNLFVYGDNLPGQEFWRRLGWVVRAELSLMQRATLPLPTGSTTLECVEPGGPPGDSSC